MTKLFVGGLPYSINDQKLNELFSQFGQVLSANVITDKFTNQSKGFGFVEMADDAAAQEAIKKLDGSDLEGRRLGVSVARPREERSNSYSNNNRGRDNYRDNNRNFYKRDRR
ncbi:RNA-binding protein [Candidatus Daviesbacteria bacterium]|nr:RNA-binding protein [Candidatus Daviesbacteria bacterium]